MTSNQSSLIFIYVLVQLALSAPPGTPQLGRSSQGQRRPNLPLGIPSSPLSRLPSQIEPGPQRGRQRSRPSLGALQPPLQQQELGPPNLESGGDVSH